MRRLSSLLASVASLAVLAPCAHAGGAGLYEPFPGSGPDPGAARTKRAQEFLGRLPGGAARLRDRLSLTERELNAGVLLDGERTVPAAELPAGGQSSKRAQPAEGFGSGLPYTLGVLGLLGLGAWGLSRGGAVPRRTAAG